jgi:putative endonuclease
MRWVSGCPEGVPSAKPAGLNRRMSFVYILKSEKTGRYYYGFTDAIEQRISIHNAGRVRSTKAYKPWKLHYFERCADRNEARKRELFFKSIDGYLWLKEKKIT